MASPCSGSPTDLGQDEPGSTSPAVNNNSKIFGSVEIGKDACGIKDMELHSACGTSSPGHNIMCLLPLPQPSTVFLFSAIPIPSPTICCTVQKLCLLQMWKHFLHHQMWKQSNVSVHSGFVMLHSLAIAPARLRGGAPQEDTNTNKASWDGQYGISWDKAKRDIKVDTIGRFASAQDINTISEALHGLDVGGDQPGADPLPGGIPS